MPVWESYLWVCDLVGIAFTLLIFAAVAFFNARLYNNKKDFLFAENIKEDDISVNISATFSSLAGPFFFFMLQSANFGYMLIVLLIFQYYGHKYFLRLIKGLSIDPEQTGSIYRLVRHLSGSKNVATAANVVVAINTFFLLSIELILGSAVFLYFATNIPNAEFVGFFGILVITVLYIISGGFKLVFLTDRWQFSLIVIGIVAALGAVFVSLSGTFGVYGGVVAIIELLRNPLLPPMFLFIFFLNILATTFTQACVQVSSWQRVASAKDYDTIRKGVDKAIKRQFLLVWFAAIVIGVITAKLGQNINGVGDIADLIKGTGFVGEFLVFPLLFIGLVAALISSADSHLISLMLSTDDFFGHWFDRTALKTVNGGVQIWFGILALLIGAGLIVEFFWFNSLETEWKTKITQLMFAGYGQAGLLFPIIYLFVIRARGTDQSVSGQIDRRSELQVTTLIVTALIVYWGCHWYAMEQGLFWLSQLAPVIGLAITSATLLVVRGERVVGPH